MVGGSSAQRAVGPVRARRRRHPPARAARRRHRGGAAREHLGHAARRPCGDPGHLQRPPRAQDLPLGGPKLRAHLLGLPAHAPPPARQPQAGAELGGRRGRAPGAQGPADLLAHALGLPDPEAQRLVLGPPRVTRPAGPLPRQRDPVRALLGPGPPAPAAGELEAREPHARRLCARRGVLQPHPPGPPGPRADPHRLAALAALHRLGVLLLLRRRLAAVDERHGAGHRGAGAGPRLAAARTGPTTWPPPARRCRPSRPRPRRAGSRPAASAGAATTSSTRSPRGCSS